MSEIYTRKIFYMFQKQFGMLMWSTGHLHKDGGQKRVYVISPFNIDGKEVDRTVIFNQNFKQQNCSCKLFEFEGIPRSHVLCVLKQEKIYTLPQQYILKRWTRQARERVVSDKPVRLYGLNPVDDVNQLIYFLIIIIMILFI